MASADDGDHAGAADRRSGVAGLVLGAVVLGVVAVLSFPTVVDWDTLGTTAVFLVSAAGAVLLGAQAARRRRDSRADPPHRDNAGGGPGR